MILGGEESESRIQLGRNLRPRLRKTCVGLKGNLALEKSITNLVKNAHSGIILMNNEGNSSTTSLDQVVALGSGTGGVVRWVRGHVDGPYAKRDLA